MGAHSQKASSPRSPKFGESRGRGGAGTKRAPSGELLRGEPADASAGGLAEAAREMNLLSNTNKEVAANATANLATLLAKQ